MSNDAALRIESIEGFPLDVPLLAPFTIASGRLDAVQNVAVRVRLAGGVEGWGEIPSLRPVTAEHQAAALAAVGRIRAWLTGRDAAAWRLVAAELAEREPRFAAGHGGSIDVDGASAGAARTGG